MTSTVNATTNRTDLQVLLTPADLRRMLETDVRRGLGIMPKQLPPKYFYDDRGSRLFEEITRLPEYYQTRTEHALLRQHAQEIAGAAGAEILLELGSGSSEKTPMLLDALTRTGDLNGYVSVDVSAGALRDAQTALRLRYPDLPIEAVVADFDHHLDQLPRSGRRLIAFLGGTIGNYPPRSRAEFLRNLATSMEPGEALLLGIDLVKDPERLVAAYDDAAGVTADFNRNVLRVLRRDLDATFEVSQFEHVAIWDADNEWIEMRLRATEPIQVRLDALSMVVDFVAGEEIRTEISAKFRRPGIEAELVAAGLSPERWWTDVGNNYALVLARAGTPRG